MEIAPIPGIRAVGALRVRPEGLQAPSIFDIDQPEKPADRGVQPAGRKASGAEDDAEDEPLVNGEPAEEETQKSVDYFA